MLWFIGVLVVIALGAMIRWAGEERAKTSRPPRRQAISTASASDQDQELERRLANLFDAAARVAHEERSVEPPREIPPTQPMLSAAEVVRMGIDAGYPRLDGGEGDEEFQRRMEQISREVDRDMRARHPERYAAIDQGAEIRRQLEQSARGETVGDGQTYLYRANLSFSTPLAMLALDGQRRGRHAQDPTWSHGSWVPDVGPVPIGYSNPAMMSRAGPFGLGQFPADGGQLLPFLREYRRIIESSETAAAKIDRCRALLPRPEFSEIAGRLPAHFPEDQFKRAINDIPGISDAMVDVLWARGCREPADVFNLTDEQLRSVPGIGPKRLEQIRVAQGAAMGMM